MNVTGFQETRKLQAKMVLLIAAVPGQSLGLLLSVATLTKFSPCSENTKIYISLMLEVSVHLCLSVGQGDIPSGYSHCFSSLVKVMSHRVTKKTILLIVY